ncbi:MAG: aspartate kinase, partial [Gemmatimonadetes bacterium]|nr:aspartate kinase [Gemmatimonadota bacterium]
MIVSKFGGTSVGDAAAIRRLAGIVAARQPERPVVVVSALSKVTDALLDLERAPDHAAVTARLAALRDRHRTVATDLGLDGAATEQLERDLVALDAWVTPRIGHAWSAADRDFLVSHGELWSSRLVTAALAAQELPAVWFDARRVIATDSQFGQAVPNPAEIRRRAARLIAPILDGNEIPVTQGFIGSDAEGWTTTLGRGGSDYTASLLGAALDAARVEIWTDVDGILTADPRLVPDARRLPEASYHEAAELAAFGAKVLHPATQLPLVEAGIPCWVLNSFAPDREGTRIVAGARPAPITATSPVRSIAWKKGITVINVRAPRSFEAVGFLQQ